MLISEPEGLPIEPDVIDEETLQNSEDAVLPTGDTQAAEHEELDPEIIQALGETTEEAPKFGAKILDNLARLWTPILRTGLSKESKDTLLKKYLIPENCPLLLPPALNPEISAAISEPSRARDKRVESIQQQLGLGVTAINRALVLLFNGDNNKLEAIKVLSDSCRILCDLHHVETVARKKFITTGLDKSFKTMVQGVNRDEMLFGSKLSEQIKASKVIEKQGLQIKRAVPAPKPLSSFVPQPSTSSRTRPQGNWSAPPRYPSNRGGRGGSRKPNTAGGSYRRGPLMNQSKLTKTTPRAT